LDCPHEKKKCTLAYFSKRVLVTEVIYLKKNILKGIVHFEINF